MQGPFVVRVLGPIDVVTETGTHRIGSRNARAVLGALVLAAGRSVSIDRLCEVVWNDQPPASADASIHTYVSRLRHLFGPDAIERIDHSYRLNISRSQIDASRFEDLIDEASALRDDPEACLARCRTALDLWRGTAFGDLGDEPAFELEVIRLEELRLLAMELALGAEIGVGRHEMAAAELESAVREHPYRERLWYLLAEALLRDDRRVDALDACERLRAVLTDAGLTAGPGLVDLEHRIVAGSSPDRTTDA